MPDKALLDVRFALALRQWPQNGTCIVGSPPPLSFASPSPAAKRPSLYRLPVQPVSLSLALSIAIPLLVAFTWPLPCLVSSPLPITQGASTHIPGPRLLGRPVQPRCLNSHGPGISTPQPRRRPFPTPKSGRQTQSCASTHHIVYPEIIPPPNILLPFLREPAWSQLGPTQACRCATPTYVLHLHRPQSHHKQDFLALHSQLLCHAIENPTLLLLHSPGGDENAYHAESRQADNSADLYPPRK